MKILRIKNLSSGYGKKQVLYDVSLDILQGETVLLIGSNGSGKSTLLKTVYGLVTPKSGEVMFNKENITNKNSSDLIKKGLVYIPQKNNCFDNLTVQENLEVSGLTVNDDTKIFKERFEKIMEYFPKLKNLLGQIPMKLSGGERQLLALAMGAINQPKMILLDEPFAGLSHHGIEDIKHQIDVLRKEQNTTFLIVEHRLREAMLMADKVFGLKLGKISEIFKINNTFHDEAIHRILI
jgi:branched-chain amino acid transport system ATP-binding protein